MRVVAIVAVLLAASPGPALANGRDYRGAAYRGLAAWIDIYDHGPWDHPVRTVRRLAGRGTATLFVQTSNYRQPGAIHRRAALARLLAAADRSGMQAIAWYLPGFAQPRRDWHRVKAAVGYVSRAGHRFDGFALDIEATAVRDVATRNRRMLSLSSRLRRLAGERAALGAIVPDPVTQRYWPGFPYRRVRNMYDAFLPMAYWTPHTHGAGRAYRHTRHAVRLIRLRTGDRSVPVHVIGGIASHATVGEVRGFARAALDSGAAGASIYDAPITSAAQWSELRRLRGLGQPMRRARAGRAPSIQAIRAPSQRLR